MVKDDLLDGNHSSESEEEKTVKKDKKDKKQRKKEKKEKKKRKKEKREKKEKKKHKKKSKTDKSEETQSFENNKNSIESNTKQDHEQDKNKSPSYFIPLSISSVEEKQQIENKEKELRESFKSTTKNNNNNNNNNNNSNDANKNYNSKNLANIFQAPEAGTQFKLFDSEDSDEKQTDSTTKQMEVDSKSTTQKKKTLAPWDKTVLKRKRAETYGFEWDHGIDKNQLLQKEGGLPFSFPNSHFNFAIGDKFKTTETRKTRYNNFKKQRKKLRGFVSMRRNAGLQHKKWLNEKQKVHQ